MEKPSMEAPHRVVVLADIVNSRALAPAERQAVQARIVALTDDNLAFRFSGGDEFEWALPDDPSSLDRLLLLRARLAVAEQQAPAVLLRCGVARGTVTIASSQGPYAEDGPAYHLARTAYEWLRDRDRPRRSSHESPFEPARSGDAFTRFADGREDPVRDALLVLMDAIMTAWKPAQWQAIRLRLEGLRYETAGKRLGVSPQAIQQRLKSADLDHYLTGHAALKLAWQPA